MKHSSVKPSSQRKAMYQAAYHARRKMLSAHLSPDLRVRYGLRSVPVRKGDTVRIMRGAYAGVEGKIRGVNLKKFRVTIDRVTREKADGTTIHVPIHPSNLIVVKLDLSDKWRASRLEALAKAKEAEEAETLKREMEVEEKGEEKREEG